MILEQTARSSAGAIIFDANRGDHFDPRWFDPEHWRGAGALAATSGGRGASWFFSSGGERFVLRHYRRGGFFGALLGDRYLDLGLANSRSWREFRLTAKLHDAGLPVPRPVAARVVTNGAVYRADLITVRLDAEPLASSVGRGAPEPVAWRAAGACVARLHAAGLDHADLNLHNVLIGREGGATVIDLDRGALRAPGAWREANLARLRRSLAKLAAGRWDEAAQAAAWRAFEGGYAAR